MLTVDGFDDAIIGFSFVNDVCVVTYDVTKMIDILMDHDGMTADEASEYFEYNIQGAYMGEQTPIYMFPTDIEGIKEISEALDG